MATTTDFTCTKDTRLARRESDNFDQGAGTGSGLAFGLYQGYRYRALLGFNINMAGWTSITSATLYFKTSNQINVAFGSDPNIMIQRITAAWSEGSSSGLSSGNASIYPGPSATATNERGADVNPAENQWDSADITLIMRDALTAGVFHGIRILGTDNSNVEPGTSANVGEIYSRESGSGTAYIRIVYETNRAPDVPTVSSPNAANGGLSASQTPTFNCYMTDPDGNAINNYHWQIDDNADFSSPIQDVYGGVAGASGVTVGVVPTTLTRGGTYYFRVQAADVSVWGGWSTTFQVKIAQVPALTMSEPSASGRLARLTYDAGSGWGSPRLVVNWAMSCPDGGSQSSWRTEVYNDSAGSPVGMIEDTGAADGQAARIIPANFVEGNYYHIRVSATCSHGLTAVVGFYRVRARWGMVIHRFDMGAATGSLQLTTLDVTDENTGGSGKVIVEYMTTPTAVQPSTWSGVMGGAGLNQHFWYRAWLLAWGASPAPSPSLNEIRITYSTAIIVPDAWARAPADSTITGDVSSYVYGTKSLRIKGTAGGYNVASQQVAVAPNTKYMLSARVQTSGPTNNPIIALSTSATGPDVLQSTPQLRDIEFEDPRSRIVAGPWDSGNNTSIFIRLYANSDTGGTVWFDAIKLEASTVVTPWSPGYVAQAVVLDSGGLQIDGSQGGVFRLRGSSGGARDLVELGAQGLRFGGEVDLYSPEAALLYTQGHFRAAGYIQSYGPMYPGGGVNAGGPIVGPYNLASGSASGGLRIGGDGVSAGKWAKILSGTIPGQYWQHQMHGHIITRYGVTEISLVVHADAGPAAQPSVNGNTRIVSDYGQQSIRTAVVVVKSVNPIVYELWVQVVGGYSFFQWYPDIIDGEGSLPVVENPATYGWQAALPAGTQYAIYVANNIRMQRGSTARNITVANGTAQGIVTFPFAFQMTPFVWAYANASAGNAAYVTIQGVSTTQFDLGLKAATVWNYGVEWMAIALTNT